MRLRILTSTGNLTEIAVTGSEAKLGKDSACEVLFDPNEYPMVSNLHARVERSGADWVLRHLSQNNKTLVNSQPVEEIVKLKQGDRIRLGYTGPFVEVVSVEAGPVPGMVLDLSLAGEFSAKPAALLKEMPPIMAISTNANDMAKKTAQAPASVLAKKHARIEQIKAKRADKKGTAAKETDSKSLQPARKHEKTSRVLFWATVAAGVLIVVVLLRLSTQR